VIVPHGTSLEFVSVDINPKRGGAGLRPSAGNPNMAMQFSSESQKLGL